MIAKYKEIEERRYVQCCGRLLIILSTQRNFFLQQDVEIALI